MLNGAVRQKAAVGIKYLAAFVSVTQKAAA
jgi:hypothetical protein